MNVGLESALQTLDWLQGSSRSGFENVRSEKPGKIRIMMNYICQSKCLQPCFLAKEKRSSKRNKRRKALYLWSLVCSTRFDCRKKLFGAVPKDMLQTNSIGFNPRGCDRDMTLTISDVQGKLWLISSWWLIIVTYHGYIMASAPGFGKWCWEEPKWQLSWQSDTMWASVKGCERLWKISCLLNGFVQLPYYAWTSVTSRIAITLDRLSGDSNHSMLPRSQLLIIAEVVRIFCFVGFSQVFCLRFVTEGVWLVL